MVQPYALKLEQPGSGGKPQLAVHPTVVHHLASRILLQKQPSLDDRRSPFNDSSNRPDNSVSKLVRRQGSVECNEKKKPATSGPNDQNLRRKVKNTMISVYGALTAIEQDDLESLRMILQQNSVPINDSVTESSLYSNFSCPVSLLDVALMLNRQNAASLLLYHGAAENPELSDLKKRESVVNNVIIENEMRLQTLKLKSQPTKEEEKRIYLLEHHVNYLRKMNSVIKKPKIPNPPSEVKVEVTSSSRATVTFGSSGITDPCVVIKYKVEWSTSPTFENIIDSQIINDIRIQSVTIGNLERGKCYTFRVSAGSMWGFGEPTVAHPKNLRISSWEDSNVGNSDRNENMRSMMELHEQIEKHRQSGVWQVVFPNNNEIAVKKKKTGLKNLFSASSRFIKNVGRGIYLASIIYTEDKVLCTVDDCLPIIQIDENIISITNDDIGWLMKLSMGWDQVANLQDSMGGAWSSNWPLRAKILEAVASMHNALGVKDIGRIHYMPLIYSNITTFLISIHFVTESQAMQSQGLAMRWMRLTKLIRKKQSNNAVEFLNKEVLSVLNFFEASQIPLDRGLYLCYLKLQSSLNTIRVTVPDNLPSMLPYVSVRPNPHITQEEWDWLRLIDNDEAGSVKPSPIQFAFHNQLLKAGDSLIHDLDLDSDLISTHRLYRLQVLELHPDVSVIMVFPRAEDVCQVHGSYDTVDDLSAICKGCSSIPIPVFEILSFSTYQPDFIATYCRLSVFLEHFITIIGYEKRQCLRESDEKVYAEQLEKMIDFQQRLDDIWKSARWISNYASIARDKANNCSVSLSSILTPPPPAFPDDNISDIGYHSDQGSSNKLQEFNQHSNAKIIGSFKNGETKSVNRSKSMAERKELKVEAIDKMFQEKNSVIPSHPNLAKQTPKRQQSDVGMASKTSESISPKISAVIRVFAAFDCALPKNTAIKLIITPMTTSQEVVALVVEQIDKLSIVKNQEKQTKSEPKEFCLVSVIGARERRLRNEFNPMKLQPPWTRGRLYVRRCDAPTSAILFGNESFV
uniref:Fibronectin type-III domain-containing protein n=1 Tax=Panagrolaimus sp. JU765 TaxID=591449 RepID=A0AC34QC80_9BILA